MNRYIRESCLIMFLWLAGCASPPTNSTFEQDISMGIRAVTSFRHSIDQAKMPLDWINASTAERYRAQLIEVSKALETHAEELKSIKESVRADVRNQFESMERFDNYELRVAIRHHAFLDQQPEDLEIERHHDGIADIKKIRGNTSYHLCLDYVIPDGPAAVLRFRLPIQGKGGKPVPYLGVRDEFGNAAISVNLIPNPKPHELHELFVYRATDRIGVLYNDRFYLSSINRLGNSMYIYFQMNDASRVIIEEVRIPSESL